MATPIGNLADLTFRGAHTLAVVDAVACEDTRVSAHLLQHLGLHKPLLALHAHNERSAAQTVLARLAAGERVAYVSDAGTPAISDPGAALVDAVRAAGYRCIPVPGVSSATTALSVSGDLHAEGFRFRGFLPSKGRARQTALQAVGEDEGCTVLFESPHRIVELVDALARTFGDRRVTLARELTKQFESVHTAQASDLPAWLASAAHHQRGEFVVVVHARALHTEAADEQAIPPTVQALLRRLLEEGLPVKSAAQVAADHYGLARKPLYQWALEWALTHRGASESPCSDTEPTPRIDA